MQMYPYDADFGHVSLLEIAYVANDPINATDPTGMVCRAQNMQSGACMRSQAYANMHASARGRTTFFGAASMTTEALANMDLNIVGANDGISDRSKNFLEGVGGGLYTRNLARFNSGSYDLGGSLAANDRAFVRYEQEQLQMALDGLQAVNGDWYNNLISEVNSVLNLNAGQELAADIMGNDVNYRNIVDQVRGDLGRDIDFANMDDRVAIGDAITSAIRADEKVMCTGSRIERDSC